MLMNPDSCDEARLLFRETLPSMLEAFSDPHVLSTLKHVDQLVAEDRPYEALKSIRSLFILERQILNPSAEQPQLALAAGE